MYQEPYPDVYLGDGVYAHFDGYQIWVRTKRENGDHFIALEPMVIEALNNYWDCVKGKPISIGEDS